MRCLGPSPSSGTSPIVGIMTITQPSCEIQALTVIASRKWVIGISDVQRTVNPSSLVQPQDDPPYSSVVQKVERRPVRRWRSRVRVPSESLLEESILFFVKFKPLNLLGRP